jgi:hypothetical protein
MLYLKNLYPGGQLPENRLSLMHTGKVNKRLTVTCVDIVFWQHVYFDNTKQLLYLSRL